MGSDSNKSGHPETETPTSEPEPGAESPDRHGESAQDAVTPATSSTPTDTTVPEGESVLTSRVARNLVLLASCGIAVSIWLGWHTEIFPLFNSLVALSGAFAWLASLGYALSDERKKGLQGLVERGFLGRPRLVVVVTLCVLACLLFLTLCGSTVVLDAHRDEEFRAFQLEPVDSFMPARDRAGSLSPHSRHKRFLLHFLFHRDYRLELTGLPDVRIRLPVFSRTVLQLPNAVFLSPRVLVRPRLTLFDQVDEGGYALTLVRDGEEFTIQNDYRGQAVWIGAFEGSGPKLPFEVERRWREELLDEPGNAPADPPWLPPAPADRSIPLEVGDRIQVAVVVTDPAGEPECEYAVSEPVSVLLIKRPSDFPQEVILNVPGNPRFCES